MTITQPSPPIKPLNPADPLSLTGWAATGAFIRCWALAMQRRPMLYQPMGHVLIGIGFAALGYGVNILEQNILEKLDRDIDRKTKLQKARQMAGIDD
ncbi:hypothetical protein HK096_006972 [Nowakowskiella sp. JEL0078]|nr:hypothetical protein HK096_006972 [Nowakowskiella sp. JEL0078]